jgi:heterodisulfide reductase subunit A
LNIELRTLSEVSEINGEAGNFNVELIQHPRYIDESLCIACGLCAEKCPKKVVDNYNVGLVKRKSAFVEYAQAVPLKYCIDGDTCIYIQKGKCGACKKFCPTGAVDFDQEETTESINVGSVVLAPGFKPFDPSQFDNYQYAKLPNVITSMEFERILSASYHPSIQRQAGAQKDCLVPVRGIPRHEPLRQFALLFGMLHVRHQRGRYRQRASGR